MEKSCGVVCINKEGKFLIIQHAKGNHWGIPKGHVEKNESEKETAIRELFEETNLKVNIINGFREEEHYEIKKDKNKVVVYFLSLCETDKVITQRKEVLNYEWLSFEDAIKRLTFDSSKEILRKSNEFYLEYIKAN